MSDNTKLPPAEERGNGYDGVDAKKVMAASARGGYNQSDMDATPSVFGATRLPLSFSGSRSIDLSLDPKEFAGLSPPQVTEELRRLLRDIDADFVPHGEDLDFAAHELVNYKAVIPGFGDPDFS